MINGVSVKCRRLFLYAISDITDPKKGNMANSQRYMLSFAKVA